MLTLNCFLYWWPKPLEKDFPPPFAKLPILMKLKILGLKINPLWQFGKPRPKASHQYAVLFCNDFCLGQREAHFLNLRLIKWLISSRLQEVEVKSCLKLFVGSENGLTGVCTYKTLLPTPKHVLQTWILNFLTKQTPANVIPQKTTRLWLLQSSHSCPLNTTVTTPRYISLIRQGPPGTMVGTSSVLKRKSEERPRKLSVFHFIFSTINWCYSNGSTLTFLLCEDAGADAICQVDSPHYCRGLLSRTSRREVGAQWTSHQPQCFH